MAIHAHRMIAKLAHDMAGELYDELAKDNRFYELNPSRQIFCETVAPTLVEHARGALTDLLNSNMVSPKEKDEIYQALLDDFSLPRGGTSVPASSLH